MKSAFMWTVFFLWAIITVVAAVRDGTDTSKYRESLAVMWLIYITIRVEELRDK